MSQVLIVGSGIAGLWAALRASERHDVTLVTKGELMDGSTRRAQGGIAAALFEDDSVADHILDTMRAGAGLSTYEAVEALCSEGPDRVRELIALPVAFDRTAGVLDRGREAAHSTARVLHAGGDATGLAIETALALAVRASGARILEHRFLADLVSDASRITGVQLIEDDGSASVEYADHVVLATGGAGQLFAHTTNPACATGDGVAAAWRAGAVIRDAEFYQFHPTTLALPGNFLVSEAVRGDGAVLRNRHGERFMQRVHPGAELAPRDVVARAIALEMEAQGGEPVVLDATALGSELLARRFPTIDAACRSAGIDWSREPVPVTPAAHYWMGGVATDVWGRTSIPGLWAVGEVACTGVHGANRLASNSLLEGLVFADRAVRAIGDEAVTRGARPERAIPVGPIETVTSPKVPGGRAALQELMWQAAGVQRDGFGLRAAAARLAAWPGQAAEATDVPTEATASTPHAAREDANLLDVARLVVAGALAREESRGAHQRADFPLSSPEFARHLDRARRVDRLEDRDRYREGALAC
jgi:L-aspartate oxidase